MEIRVYGHQVKVEGREQQFRRKIEIALRSRFELTTLVVAFLPKMDRIFMPTNESIENFVEVIPLKSELFQPRHVTEALAEATADDALEVIFTHPVTVWTGRINLQ